MRRVLLAGRLGSVLGLAAIAPGDACAQVAVPFAVPGSGPPVLIDPRPVRILSEAQIDRRLRAQGFLRVGVLRLEGFAYITDVQDRAGRIVKLVLDARNGAIVSARVR